MDQILILLSTGGIMEYLSVPLQTLIIAYLALKVLDFGTGLLKTWRNGGYQSSKMRDGVIRWIAELMAVLFTLIMDLILGLNFLTYMTLVLFVYKECGSLIENLGECGVNFPEALKNKIEVLNPGNKDNKGE